MSRAREKQMIIIFKKRKKENPIQMLPGQLLSAFIEYTIFSLEIINPKNIE